MPSPRQEDPAIEALRGFAALMVMAAHYTHLVSAQPGAWGFATTGVDLFFVLSGFVFGPYFFGKPLPLVPHLLRRFFRLYPLYLLALVTYAVLKMPDPSAWRYFALHAVMGHTLDSPAIAFFYNPAFWSLPAEVEFYLALPLLAWLATRVRFAWVFGAALAAHLLLVAFAVPGEGVTARAIATVHLPGLLVEFCLGAAAWWLAQKQSGGLHGAARLAAGVLAVAGACWLFARFLVPGAPESAVASIWVGGNIGVMAGLGYALVVSAVAARPGVMARWALALCLLAGQLSYGVYLFHNAAPQLLGRAGMAMSGGLALAACVLLTVMLAFVLHHAVEAPLRNLGRDLSRRASRPAA
ncbi:MAG: acyltransferase [Burkholderiales bacterium]|nr:acyltransferase [Burkholderiales bacterium]